MKNGGVHPQGSKIQLEATGTVSCARVVGDITIVTSVTASATNPSGLSTPTKCEKYAQLTVGGVNYAVPLFVIKS
jgi:hypothetical protein